MTAKTTLTATLPDGTVATRTTDHAYTHVVVVKERNADIYAAAEAHADYLEGQVKRLRTLSPSDSQFSCRDHNLALDERRWAAAVEHLGTLPCTGNSYAAVSWHSSNALAVKAQDALHNRVKVGGLNTEIVEVTGG